MGGAVGWPKTIKKKCPAQDSSKTQRTHGFKLLSSVDFFLNSQRLNITNYAHKIEHNFFCTLYRYPVGNFVKIIIFSV